MQKTYKIKKDIKKFLASEEGKIVEKDAVKLGLALVAATGVLSGVMKPEDVQAACAYTPTCALPSCHASHSSHASHGSHGAHGRGGGWC